MNLRCCCILLVSLLGSACSGETGGEAPGPSCDPLVADCGDVSVDEVASGDVGSDAETAEVSADTGPVDDVEAPADAGPRQQRRVTVVAPVRDHHEQHDGRNVLVVARAGSGKTRVLTTKALWLQQVRGVDPSQLLLLAFNVKAAEEMRKRLEPHVGAEMPHVLRLST